MLLEVRVVCTSDWKGVQEGLLGYWSKNNSFSSFYRLLSNVIISWIFRIMIPFYFKIICFKNQDQLFSFLVGMDPRFGNQSTYHDEDVKLLSFFRCDVCLYLSGETDPSWLIYAGENILYWPSAPGVAPHPGGEQMCVGQALGRATGLPHLRRWGWSGGPPCASSAGHRPAASWARCTRPRASAGSPGTRSELSCCTAQSLRSLVGVYLTHGALKLKSKHIQDVVICYRLYLSLVLKATWFTNI